MHIHKLYQFSNINVHNFCKEKDLKACVIKLYLPRCTTGIVNIYRFPSGNCEYFLNNLETHLNSTSSNSMELIICGDLMSHLAQQRLATRRSFLFWVAVPRCPLFIGRPEESEGNGRGSGGLLVCVVFPFPGFGEASWGLNNW
jgi:hypothetical protein